MIIEVNFPNLRCDSATSGQQAIDKVRKRVNHGKELYKLILMDINMPPGIDGSETCKRLRKQYARELAKTAIVAFTAIPKDQFGNPHDKKFDGILNKPSNLADVKEVLHKAGLI